MCNLGEGAPVAAQNVLGLGYEHQIEQRGLDLFETRVEKCSLDVHKLELVFFQLE